MIDLTGNKAKGIDWSNYENRRVKISNYFDHSIEYTGIVVKITNFQEYRSYRRISEKQDFHLLLDNNEGPSIQATGFEHYYIDGIKYSSKIKWEEALYSFKFNNSFIEKL